MNIKENIWICWDMFVREYTTSALRDSEGLFAAREKAAVV